MFSFKNVYVPTILDISRTGKKKKPNTHNTIKMTIETKTITPQVNNVITTDANKPSVSTKTEASTAEAVIGKFEA